MNKKRLTKIVTMSFFLMSILAFLYSLGFFTDFLPIRSAYRDLYDNLQWYNRSMFNLAVVAVIPIVLMLTFDSHKTTAYSIVNKIINLGAAGLAFYQSYFVLSLLPYFKTEYMKIDVEQVRVLYPDYVLGKNVFAFGYLVYGLLVLSAVGILVVAFLNNKKSKEVAK